MSETNKERQNTYQYIMRKIDIYGEPLQWYIGNNETYHTVAGGFRTFLVISIAIIFLLYSIIMLFKDRNGSFVMYDISYSELDDADFVYFRDFEIFFFFKSSSAMMEMDTSIFQAYLTQINATDNSYMAQYPFNECDNEYFSEQLGFSANVRGRLEKTYCINASNYNSDEMTFSLAQVSPLGETTNSVQFILMQTCNSGSCTDDENSKFKETISSIKDVKVFIKSHTPNPLNMNNPLQSEVISFTLTSTYKGATVYFKNYNISTQSSLIPYIVGANKTHFLAYDYYTDADDSSSTTDTSSSDPTSGSGGDGLNSGSGDDSSSSGNSGTGSDGSSSSGNGRNRRRISDSSSNSRSNTYYLEFYLSSKCSFLEREYIQLDTTLANFIGVFNGLEVAGRILTFVFDSFSKEFFIFNYILKDRMFIKRKKGKKYVSNPPKITGNSNNETSNNGSKDGELIHLHNENIDITKKKNSNSMIKNNYITDENLIDKNKSSTDKESNNVIISEKIKNKNENENKKGKEKEIDIGIFKSFWCNILMTFDKDKSRYPEIENALERIRLIQDFFDTSCYINLILDMIRLKKVIFDERQLKLFESINFTYEEIQNYLDKYAKREDVTPDKFISQNIKKSYGKKNSKLTENIIGILKKQIDVQSD